VEGGALILMLSFSFFFGIWTLGIAVIDLTNDLINRPTLIN
jgi:hypothetical protein